jgi:hypothetical protein
MRELMQEVAILKARNSPREAGGACSTLFMPGGGSPAGKLGKKEKREVDSDNNGNYLEERGIRRRDLFIGFPFHDICPVSLPV